MFDTVQEQSENEAGAYPNEFQAVLDNSRVTQDYPREANLDAMVDAGHHYRSASKNDFG